MPVYSFRLPNADYLGFPATTEAIVETAVKAEELGFDALFVNDHVIVDDSPRSAPWRNVYDPLMVLSYVAARTSRIRLGTSVLIMPYRNPIVTAKMVATLDQMSGGRAIAGVGAGWSEAEYNALGVPYRERGARTTEYLRLWKACWEPGPTTFHGRFFSFDNMHVSPKPLQQPHPPVWNRRVGAAFPAARCPVRRCVAAYADAAVQLDQQPGIPARCVRRDRAERAAAHPHELPGQLQPHHREFRQRQRPAHRPGQPGTGCVRHETLPSGGGPGGVSDKLQRLRQSATTAGLHGRAGPGCHPESRGIGSRRTTAA